MLSSLLTVVAVTAIGGPPPHEAARPSYLFQMETDAHLAIRLHGEPYQPQSGDLVFFDDDVWWQTKLYNYCGTSNPLHVGLVFRHRDGSLAVLEAGPGAVQKVVIFDLDERFHSFDGTILVRRLKTPLGPEATQHLSEFSHAQEGKPYALGRLILQGTPLRPHGTLRSQIFGRTVLDRDRWICSELATAALTVAGVLEAKTYPANAMFPRDLCYDERRDLSPFFEPPALWYPRAQVERVGAGVRLINPRD